MNRELLKSLRPVKRRIRRNRFLRGAAAGLAAGLGAAALLQAASFAAPVPDRGLWAAGACATVTLAAALANALRPVSNTTAAEKADACGLQERAVTALEGGNEPIRLLQRQDACRALDRLDVKQIRPGSVKKALLAALGCAAALGCLLLIPSPRDPEAAAAKTLNRTLTEGRQAIARAEAGDEPLLSEEKRNELRKITGDLSRELGESRDATDALVALDRAEKRIEQLRQQTAGDAETAADGQTGEGGQASGDGEGQGTAPGASAKADGGQPGGGTAGKDPAAAQLQTLQALSALKNAVNPSARKGTAVSGTAAAGVAAGGMPGGENGAAGTGGGAEGKKAGGGAGEGSTNLEQKGGGKNSGHAAGTRDPRRKEVQYETIYDPERIDRALQSVTTDQNRLEDEGAAQAETGPGRGSVNGDVPWGDALQDYAGTEARAADRENLTQQERQWVDMYYRLLTEQK